MLVLVGVLLLLAIGLSSYHGTADENLSVSITDEFSTQAERIAVSTLTAQLARGDFHAHRERQKVGICMMVNNEAAYVDEFLLYHLLSGVNHFYIYDDESTDNLASALAPFIEGGIVTLKTLRNQTG